MIIIEHLISSRLQRLHDDGLDFAAVFRKVLCSSPLASSAFVFLWFIIFFCSLKLLKSTSTIHIHVRRDTNTQIKKKNRYMYMHRLAHTCTHTHTNQHTCAWESESEKGIDGGGGPSLRKVSPSSARRCQGRSRQMTPCASVFIVLFGFILDKV